MSKYKNNILILFAHPALQKSRVNRHLITYVRNIEGVTFHDLYEAYPDFHIHIKKEQNLLEAHDIIVLHHPIFWFSTPAIIKEWFDLVLVHGWAFGREGRALQGKKMLSVISTGGRESLYQTKGFHGHTIGEFLYPIQQTARVCRMDYLPPFVVHGTHTLTPEEIGAYGREYQKIIAALRDGNIDLEKAREYPMINVHLKEILTAEENG
ncbi:MAG: NAD(P)H-dependent oxidoreductase [Nitrospiraceae bacterium]|nr:MAG: NAD(P)H-dependent oxidoreductase [Nitrospiraceae bacterium]